MDEKYVLLKDYEEAVGKYDTLEEAEKAMKEMSEDSFDYLQILDETHYNMFRHM